MSSALCLLLFTSCDTSATEEKYVFKDSTGLTPSVPLTVTTDQPQVLPVNTNQPIQIDPTKTAMPLQINQGNTDLQRGNKPVISTPVVTQTNAVTPTAPGMNPPHGQPGHRCDISVGAPLNSKPNPQPTTVSTTTAKPVITQQLTPVAKTLPGMNPPHGEPGHRCDIAVGAPLNSKPNPQPTKVSTTTAQPVLTQEPTTVSKTLPGMNPPHGQSGHRCEIAVGAPLSSAPPKKDSTH